MPSFQNICMHSWISPLINYESYKSRFSWRPRPLSCFWFRFFHPHPHPSRQHSTTIGMSVSHVFAFVCCLGHWKRVSRLQSADVPALASGSHPASAAPSIHPPPPHIILLLLFCPLLLLLLFWFNSGFSSWLHFAPKCLSALKRTNISHVSLFSF